MPAKHAAKPSCQLIGPPKSDEADEIVAASSEIKLSKTIAVEARSACAIMIGARCFGLFGVIFQRRGRHAESSGDWHLKHAAHNGDQCVVMDRMRDGVHQFATNCRSDRRSGIKLIVHL